MRQTLSIFERTFLQCIIRGFAAIRAAFKLLRFVAGVGDFLLGLYIIGHMHTTWRMSRIVLIDVSPRVLGWHDSICVGLILWSLAGRLARDESN